MAAVPEHFDDDETALLVLQAVLEDSQERLDSRGISEEEAFALALQRVNLEENLAVIQNRIAAVELQSRDQEEEETPNTHNHADDAIQTHDEQIETPSAQIPSDIDESAPTGGQDNRECLGCMMDFPANELTECACTHEYCEGCIEQLFVKSLTDETLFPPACCHRRIDLNTNWGFMNTDLLLSFRRREEEMSTTDRTYCAKPDCGAWISPRSITGGYGNCPKGCPEATCVLCKNLRHDGSECPKDEQLEALVARKGWKRCSSCNRFVELETGCYHITCRCGAEFCYLCGARWVAKGTPGACHCVQFDTDYVIYEDPFPPPPPPPPPPCAHSNWKRFSRPGRCSRCRVRMRQTIEECADCRVKMCRRCRFNRH